jgi:S-adenosylmethionine synthetase
MRLYSNEIVFRGHPDKVCDQISDAILDAYLEEDKKSRVAVEIAGGKGIIFITGEVTSRAAVDAAAVAKRVIKDVGYDPSRFLVIDNIGRQSSDIAQGVDTGGAGDNGMMFGYACNDTPQLLPTAMVILQMFSQWYDELRQVDTRFLPDGKAQITGIYDDDFKLQRIKTFTLCYQNLEVDRPATDQLLMRKAVDICSKYGVKVDKFLINPTGRFRVGGFDADAGLTGRKIVVDSYHSFANVGGGAFSGKDPTKVDRSGAYKAREIAKEYLQEYGLRWCEVQLSYAIGRDRPLAIYINSDRGYFDPPDSLYDECRPANIIRDLDLLNVKYEELARFGHFK